MTRLEELHANSIRARRAIQLPAWGMSLAPWREWIAPEALPFRTKLEKELGIEDRHP